MPKQRENCMWCDEPSVLLCDAVIGFEAVAAIRDAHGKVTGLMTGTNPSGECVAWTCDAPMCRAHAKRVGHVCGSAPDSIDRCPYHAASEEHGMDKLVMFEHEAEQRRRDVHAEIRRRRMRHNTR